MVACQICMALAQPMRHAAQLSQFVMCPLTVPPVLSVTML